MLLCYKIYSKTGNRKEVLQHDEGIYEKHTVNIIVIVNWILSPQEQKQDERDVCFLYLIVPEVPVRAIKVENEIKLK